MTASLPEVRLLATHTIRLDPRFQFRRYPDGKPYDQARVERMGVFDVHKYSSIEVWPSEATFSVLSGFHRLACAKRCNVKQLTACVRDVPFDEALRIARRSNAREKPYTSMELAGIVRTLHESGMDFRAISEELDQKPAEYYERLEALSHVDHEVADAVESNALGLSQAEVIGEAAKRGASPALQNWLMFRASSVSLVVFKALARRLTDPKISPIKSSSQNWLFDAPKDAEYGEAAVEQISHDLKVRDSWKQIATAGQRLLKMGCTEGQLVEMVDSARRQASDINHAMGLGDDSAIAATVVEADTAVETPIVAHPILKWAGGKRDSLPYILPHVRAALAQGTGKLFEPFSGSAAVTLAIAPKSGLLSDAEPGLQVLYDTVRLDAEGVYEHLKALIERGTAKEAYTAMRGVVFIEEPREAARMIYLSKLAYNGLWRTNKKGEMNVPWGGNNRHPEKDKSACWPTLADLVTAGRALAHVTVRCLTWQEALSLVNGRDTIYADPPYEGTFTSYGPKWTSKDFDDLAAALEAFGENFILVSQPDTPKSRKRYAWCHEAIEIPRPAGWKMCRRTKAPPVGELLFIGGQK